MISKKYLILFFIFISLWCFGIFSPVIFQNEKAFLIVKPFLNQAYSTVCHQSHDKVISLHAAEIFVCPRCAGIYLGLFFVGIFSLLATKTFKRPLLPFLLSSIFMLIDVSFTTFKVYNYSKTIALIAGLLFGSTIFLFLLDELKNSKVMDNYEK